MIQRGPISGKLSTNNTSSPEEKRANGSIMSRRTFLGVSGGAVAGLIALHYIKWPDFDFLSSSEDPGEGVIDEIFPWPATSCLNCPTRCAIKVRVVNGKVVRIIGNPESNYSDGKTCPRSHVGLQVLYNPDRIEKPMRRTNYKKGRDDDPQWEEIEWEDALAEIQGNLNTIGDHPEKLLIVQGLNTTSDEDLIDRFARAFGTTNLLREDMLEKEADREGKRLANLSDHTGYDLENTNYILSFGADIIESEVPLSRNLHLWGKIRRGRPNRARMVAIDSRYSLTASKADEWIRINPGTEGALAMGIANVIIRNGWYDEVFVENHTSGFTEYKTLVENNYNPDTVANITGIDAPTIERIAEEFASDKPSIAWSGAGATNWPHGTYTSHAIYCLNALVGSIDVNGGIIYREQPAYQGMPDIDTDNPGISFRDTKDSLSNIDTVIGFNSNLIMSVPETSTWDEYLAQVPFYVHIGPSWNEMANYADIILPACTYLEEWAYESSLPGSDYTEVKIKQPVIKPLFESRPIAGIIFDLVDQLGSTVATKFAKYSILNKSNIETDPEGFIKYRTEGLDSFSWDNFKTIGVWTGSSYAKSKYDKVFKNGSGKFIFHNDSLRKEKLLDVDFKGIDTDDSLVLTTYHPVLDIRNGNQNYPWAQEIFLVMHGYGWKNFVEMNKDDADELGIEDMDWVYVRSESGNRINSIKVRARVFDGIMPGVVAISMGQGHYSCGEWADGMGVNPNEIICTDYDIESGQASFRNTRVRIEKV